ncbi:methyl-accepting chemotaxis protein [Pseudomonas syringae pv. actinidiae]|nr:methyl-accepting chemotaxis protein [Pseudomonas syringae pv. actinidiae]
MLAEVHAKYDRGDYAGARAEFYSDVNPVWLAGRKQLNELIVANKQLADQATANIVNAVLAAKISMVLSLLVAVLAAAACGLLLMRSIMAPMQLIVRILDIMRTGDLSTRLNLSRKDEFNAVETGFNDMMTDLTTLVAQAQRSSVQVHVSYRNRRDFPSATGHGHRNRRDHHRDWRNFAGNCRHLAGPRTHHDRSDLGGRSGLGAGRFRPAGPGAHGRHHASGDGRGQSGQRQTGDPQREGR